MIDSMVSLSNVRVAGAPTFFPSDDPKKHRCLITVIKNRGKNQQGVELTDEFTLVYWGKYAQTAALYLDKGRAINVDGVLRSYTVDTGRIKPNGKKELNRTTSIHVKGFEFSADSLKALSKRIGGNMALIQAARENGTRDPNAPMTPEELLTVNRPPAYDYNPTTAAATGRYGNAQVYIKGIGMLVAGSPVPMAGIPVGAPVGTPADTAATLARMQAEMNALRLAAAGGTAVIPPAAVIPPVAGTVAVGADGQPISPFG